MGGVTIAIISAIACAASVFITVTDYHIRKREAYYKCYCRMAFKGIAYGTMCNATLDKDCKRCPYKKNYLIHLSIEGKDKNNKTPE